MRRDAKKQKQKKKHGEKWKRQILYREGKRWQEMAEEKMQKVLALLRFFTYDKK